LERQFYLAKLALHEFKNYMRAQGVNVENFDITITNNRINYSKIPDTYRGIFEIMFKNNLSADSFKARNTHKSLSSFFNQAPGYTKNLFSPHPNLLNPKNISGNNSSPLDLKNISLNNSNQLNSNNISLNHANLLNPENNLSLLRMR
ncbi:MAG: hypothetical protein JO131_03030, partial [Gammaproteobacteria bacterium]|nr:hypothetical protein [Gammaproteobacteria bacterium]